ncbi:MAG: hypothetical protein L0Y80_08910 [Ignavibacteriae bacterium]|nr:hypothetical protein [Ignavibacteriota bacterium]
MSHVILIITVAIAALNFSKPTTVDRQRSDPDSTEALVTFGQQIAPLLKTNCSPCHFEGGQVYGRYPFDDYVTVKKLGEQLNTRLKEKGQKSLVTDWLKSGAREK